MADDLVEWLRLQLDEDERWARAAKGVRWQWVYNETDEVVEPNPMLSEYLESMGSEAGHTVVIRMDLRSVETKTHPPETGYGSLPVAWALHYAEEVDSSAAGHIIRWDPARVLREVEAKRKILDEAIGWRHRVVEDCWYTCPAATEERDGGDTCNENWTEGVCNCGVERRRNAILLPVAAIYSDRPGFREEWRT
jgi:hypothetical protein